MSILRVSDLSKSYRGRSGHRAKALQKVSIELSRGECLGIVGESASGKTTLARCILRLEPADAGRIDFLGHNWLQLRGKALRRLRQKMQAVFQDPYTSLNPLMKAGAIVEEPLLIHHLGDSPRRRAKVEEAFAKVGLNPGDLERHPHQFSGGERQRLALARALICEPELLIADEPLSALDVSTQGQILELLIQLRSQLGLTILFISHSLSVVRRFCHRTAVLYRGRLLELAPTEELFSDPLHPYTRALVRSHAGSPAFPAEEWPGNDADFMIEGDFRQVRTGRWLLG